MDRRSRVKRDVTDRRRHNRSLSERRTPPWHVESEGRKVQAQAIDGDFGCQVTSVPRRCRDTRSSSVDTGGRVPPRKRVVLPPRTSSLTKAPWNRGKRDVSKTRKDEEGERTEVSGTEGKRVYRREVPQLLKGFHTPEDKRGGRLVRGGVRSLLIRVDGPHTHTQHTHTFLACMCPVIVLFNRTVEPLPHHSLSRGGVVLTFGTLESRDGHRGVQGTCPVDSRHGM